MKQQPRYIPTQLHQEIAGSTISLNYAVWESFKHFSNPINHLGFQETLKDYPSSTVTSPHLFVKLPFLTFVLNKKMTKP